MSIQIHPTAVVSKDANIGDNVVIGPYCVIDGKTTIGAGSVIRSFARVCDYTVMGENCVIHEHAVIGGVPQDLSYKGEETWALLGNNVVCREYVTVNRAVGEGAATKIGDGCFIMENVHVAHNAVIGRSCTIANKTGISGHVHIDDFVVIGGMSGFHQFVHIGSYCMIGGMSRVTQDVPPYALASGNPPYVYDINRVGLKRRNFDAQTRKKIREMYRIIYNSGLTIRDGLSKIAADYPNDREANLILEFAKNSSRGFTPRMTQSWSNSGDENQHND